MSIFSQIISGSFKFSLTDESTKQKEGTIVIEGIQNFQNDLENILITNMYPGQYQLTIYYKNHKNAPENTIKQSFEIVSGKVIVFSMNAYGRLEQKTLLDANSVPLCELNNNNRPNNHRDNDRHGHKDPPPQPPVIVAPQPISPLDFSNMYNAVKNETFSTNKIKTLKTTANFHPYFTTDQVRQLATLFTADAEKLDVVKYLVPKVLDVQNITLLKDCFTYSNTKKQYLDFIRSLQH
jgi:hypothetical protein